MKKHASAFLIILVFASGFVSAQQSMPPFVSRLTARIDDATIRLTWQDADVEVPQYLVYRSAEEITSDSFENASLVGKVASGEMTFVDHPLDDTLYFYAVVAADSDGAPSMVFVPYRNKTTVGTGVDAESLAAALPVAITGIKAKVVGSEIVLTFSSSSAKREISVYRGTQPITTTDELLAAVFIDTIPSSQTEFRDIPVAGLDYYYALFDTELLRAGKQRFARAENVLANSIRIPEATVTGEPASASTIRTRPLPFLVLTTKLETGESLGGPREGDESPVALSSKVVASLDSIIPPASGASEPIDAPVILPQDRITSDDGSRSDLSRIVSPLFEQGDWEKVRSELESFLSTRRSAETTYRARFYIGQAYYFEASYREAFIQFLYSSESYYASASPWMDSILLLLSSDPQASTP